MWLGELSKVGVPSIYFDAFANDYHDDAFITVAGEIIARAEALKPRNNKALKTFKGKAVSVAKVLGRASLRFGVRAASAGVLTEEDGLKVADEIAKAAGDEAAKGLDELLTERLGSHKADREAFDQFRKSLTELSETLARPAVGRKSEPTQEGASKSRKCPLVFVIDELDRCRPPFALALLEKIKHLFAVPGVIFVLVSSLQQLEAAVRLAYGDIDTRTYLEKFYHLRLLLPSGRPGRTDLRAQTYLIHLYGTQGQGVNDISRVFGQFCRVRPLSLRTLERIVAYAKIAEISMPEVSRLHIPFIAGLSVMKVISPDLYAAARSGTLVYKDVENLFCFSKWRSDDLDQRTPMSQRVEDFWRYALGSLDNEQRKQQMDTAEHGYIFRRIIGDCCDLIDCFSLPA